MDERIAVMRKGGVVRIKDYFGAVGSRPLVRVYSSLLPKISQP